MNIFETIGRATSRIERFHSQFLADSLCESLKGDRSLFEQVWTLVAPSGWEIPERSHQVRVIPEQGVEGGRLDICIHCFTPQDRVVGIEIKTVEDSTEPGQLERYRAGLKKKFPESEIQIAYLTPFNKEHAGNGADSLPTVMEFVRFQRLSPEARHVSWLDLESIPWDGNMLWEQHRAYVRNHISSSQNRRASVEQNRDLAFFYGVEPAERFWAEVRALTAREEGKRVFIDLADQPDPSAVAKTLVRAFEILLRSDNVVECERNDKFKETFRQRFLNSNYREVHAALFDLAQRFDYVWLKGEGDYGVRTAHKDYPDGVSLVTSDGPGRLFVLVRR